jgi:hypothetical protein
MGAPTRPSLFSTTPPVFAFAEPRTLMPEAYLPDTRKGDMGEDCMAGLPPPMALTHSGKPFKLVGE